MSKQHDSEKWVNIVDFPNHYISNRGRVLVKARRVKTPWRHYRLVPEKILTPMSNGKHMRYGLSHNHRRAMKRVDLLLKEYFPEDPFTKRYLSTIAN